MKCLPKLQPLCRFSSYFQFPLCLRQVRCTTRPQAEPKAVWRRALENWLLISSPLILKWPWTSYFISLCLTFLMYHMEVTANSILTDFYHDSTEGWLRGPGQRRVNTPTVLMLQLSQVMLVSSRAASRRHCSGCTVHISHTILTQPSRT